MTDKFNPNDKVTNLRGRDYLEVKWRVAWFRDDHPDGSILTEIISNEPLIVRAHVYNGEGKELATGMGGPTTQGVAAERKIEKAETAAIGRALAHAGYGTQFTGEDEGEHLADAPVEPLTVAEKAANHWPDDICDAAESGYDFKARKHTINWLNMTGFTPSTATPEKIHKLASAYANVRPDYSSPEHAMKAAIAAVKKGGKK